MAYSDVYAMTLSVSLRGRIAAAVAVEPGEVGEPESWAYNHRYDMASAPGWDAAWASAVASGNPDPGADPAVITDGQILSQVQAVLSG